MKIIVRGESVTIEGYVNAVERASKPLMSRMGQFIERICKGAFEKALKRNDDVHILLNHDWARDLGSTKSGNLELREDSIGLCAKATITDREVVEKARNNELVGWSFGFSDRDVDKTTENGFPVRAVKDLDLYEVSILDRTKSPAYEGTLIHARADDGEKTAFSGENFIAEVECIVCEEEVVREEQAEPEPQQEEKAEEVNYSEYDKIIEEMKGV